MKLHVKQLSAVSNHLSGMKKLRAQSLGTALKARIPICYQKRGEADYNAWSPETTGDTKLGMDLLPCKSAIASCREEGLRHKTGAFQEHSFPLPKVHMHTHGVA